MKSSNIQPTSVPIQVLSVREGWHAPGYRDPQLHFKTAGAEFHFQLTPQAFVELHDMLCEEQDCIDRNGHAALDIERYPHHTRHMAKLRETRPPQYGCKVGGAA